MRRLLFALLLLVCAIAGARERYTTVYVFGFALSFQDSVCVMTSVQSVDSAYINNEGFLQERTLYAYQMENRLEENGRPAATCVIFWDEKRATVEKQFARLRKKYTDDGEFKLQSLEGFSFVREEHISN